MRTLYQHIVGIMFTTVIIFRLGIRNIEGNLLDRMFAYYVDYPRLS